MSLTRSIRCMKVKKQNNVSDVFQINKLEKYAAKKKKFGEIRRIQGKKHERPQASYITRAKAHEISIPVRLRVNHLPKKN